MDDLKTMYTLAETCNLLKVGKRTLYRWVHDGYAKAVKVGGQWRFTADEVKRLQSGK